MNTDSGSVQAPARGGFSSSLPPAVWLLIALLPAAFLFSPVWHFDYVWDDRAFFITSTTLRQGNLLDAITQPVLIGTTYFRPLVMLWFASELRLFGMSAPWAHIANLALHLTNALMVGLLVLRLAGDRRREFANVARAVAASLLYVFHPALIEPTAWVSGRFDLTATFFCLLGLLAITSRHAAVVACTGLAFLAAAFSKEMAATFPALAFLLVWAARRPEASLPDAVRPWFQRPLLAGWIGVAIAAGVYLALRFHYIQTLQVRDAVLDGFLSNVFTRLAFIGYSIELYVRLAVWPFVGLGPLHPFDLGTFTTVERVHGCAVLLAAIVLVAACLARPGRARLLVVAALLALLPVINIIPLTIVGNLGHERFLALPLVFAVLALVHVPVEQWKLSPLLRARGPVLLVGALLLWCGVAVLNLRVTLPLWRNELTLWRWTYGQYPNLQYAQFSLAAAALREQRFDIAKEVIDHAQAAGPIPLRLSIPYGQYLIRTGHAAEGIAKLQDALGKEFQPHLQAIADGVDIDQAEISKTENAGWLLVYAYTVLAEGHLTIREFPQAREDARAALYYQRDNPTSLMLRSFATYGLGDWPLAEAQFAQAKAAYWPEGRGSAEDLRGVFLQQLCKLPDTAAQVCQHVASTTAGAVPPK